MPDSLSVSKWKSLLREHADAKSTDPLTKALERNAKAESKAKDDPETFVETLEDVIDRAKDAQGANRKNVKLTKYLGGILDDAGKEKVRAERRAQELKERAREESEEEGEGDETAKLTERLLKVKRLDADNAKAFVLALGGKVHGLVIGKKASVETTMKTRAKAMREGNGRLFTGKVFGEKGKHVFVMLTAPPGGLAKAIKKAAGHHTELPALRVLVRGPGVELNDETDQEEMADLGPGSGEDDGDEGEPRGVTSGTPPETATTSTAPTVEPDDATVFQGLLDAVTEPMKEALRGGGEHAQWVKAKHSEAQLASRKKAYKDGIAALKELQERLKAPPTGSVGEKVPSTVALDGSRRAWEAARSKMQTDLTTLTRSMRADFRGEPEYPEIDAAANEIAAALAPFDSRLTETLNQALQTDRPEERGARCREAKALLKRYRVDLMSNALIKELDTNPFAPVSIHKTLNDALAVLSKSLGV
jgi:hypothetical protein